MHLKRFSPLGNKIGQHVNYDERISLTPYMSEGQYGPSYTLYGVICHAGGGPNSGHYYAFIKGADGSWFEMNDESVSPYRGPAVRIKNAYILFYMRIKGDRLESAVQTTSLVPLKVGLVSVASMKKRKATHEEQNGGEDTGTKVSSTFIGPLLPKEAGDDAQSSPKRPKLNPNDSDPQADTVKKKIAETKKVKETSASSTALSGLADYHSDSEEPEKVSESTMQVDDESPRKPESSAPESTASQPIPISSKASFHTPISPNTFYSSAKDRKSASPSWINNKSLTPFGGRLTSRYGKKRNKARGI